MPEEETRSKQRKQNVYKGPTSTHRIERPVTAQRNLSSNTASNYKNYTNLNRGWNGKTNALHYQKGRSNTISRNDNFTRPHPQVTHTFSSSSENSGYLGKRQVHAITREGITYVGKNLRQSFLGEFRSGKDGGGTTNRTEVDQETDTDQTEVKVLT